MQLDFGGWLWDETDRRARINRKTDAIMTKLTADYPCFFAAVTLLVGTWLSLVEHSLGVRGVGSSNLPVPTNSNRPVISRAYNGIHPALLNRTPELRQLR